MQKQQYEVHPIANVFPMMSRDEFEALKQDIKEHGQREPIVFWKNMLVDGRNRLKACEELGIDPDESELMDETDPVAWVISHNLHRRHLTESQRAMVAGKLANMKKGRPSEENTSIEAFSIPEAAKTLNVGKASVERAKAVIAEGSTEVQQAVEQGELPVSVASELVKAVPDKKQQTAIVSKGADAVRQAVKETKTSTAKAPKVQSVVEKSESEVNLFLLFWQERTAMGKKAIWLWLQDNYGG